MKYDILERGTPAWLRRLARPLPGTAQSPNWRQLAHCFNRVFIEDEQIKADENRWRAANTLTSKTKGLKGTLSTGTFLTRPIASIVHTTPLADVGEPMDLDAIKTP